MWRGVTAWIGLWQKISLASLAARLALAGALFGIGQTALAHQRPATDGDDGTRAIDRVGEIRARLLESDGQDNATQDDRHGKRERRVQWWPNWPNWGNYWRNW